MSINIKEVQNKTLYKYCDVTTAIKILESRSLNFQNPELFNDPFDCYEGLINFSIPRKELLQLLDKYLKPKLEGTRQEKREIINKYRSHPNLILRKMKESLHMEKQRLGVSCFSTVSDEILMWSHYAQKHEGICLGFRFLPVVKSLYAIYPVQYTDKIDKIGIDKPQNAVLWHWLLTKSNKWSYEKELRAISLEHQGLISFLDESLIEVIYGSRTKESDKKIITRLLRTKTELPNLFKMQINEQYFQLDKIPLKLN